MNKKLLLFFSLFLTFFICSLTGAKSFQNKTSPSELPESYRKWLTEEVVYIITPKEKDVFLQLKTDRERNLFIEAFWKQRDPNPKTSENEFKKEHYRRISYANQWFGKESPGPGWRTDMGRIYITLGEPKTIERFENLTEVYPVIIWFYEGMIEYGLPNAFNVVFFKKGGIGEYELYSPVKFGPQNLLIHYKGDPTNYLAAYNELLGIEPNIASVSLSLIEGESTYIPSPSIASEILITFKVPSAPHKKVEDVYAEKLLKYKDIIEVDYTTNYIGNDSFINVIMDKSGIFFVHYIIEPKKLSLEQYVNKFYTDLEINGNISDLNGNTIFQYEKTIPIEFNEEQLNKIKDKLFSFQDMFPLIEGNYRFNLLLKNTISKEFTSLEKDITIPKASTLQMSSLILANKIIKDSKYTGKNKPFLMENLQLVPSPRNDFSHKDNLYLFFQIYGLNQDLRENGYLELSIFRSDKKVHSLIKNIKEYPDKVNFLEEISLANFPADYYKIKVTLFDENKDEILSEHSNFYISNLAFLPRPWVLSLPGASSDDPLYLNILGNQSLNKKEIQAAKSLLEKAYRKNPNSIKFALDFSRALLMAKEYQRVKQIAMPFLNTQEKYEFFAILGQSCQALGELAEAISYYKDYLSHYGTNLLILNSIGTCYYQLGNREEALIAWEKSLELNPNQEKLKNIVESIKEKK
ncbi:MAG: GWxTD domain-containing protein [Candidatus Aminicenantes bacterium]|nr:GWxTD domain-containing protein [Candidatus Aminicenantes bacterium]